MQEPLLRVDIPYHPSTDDSRKMSPIPINEWNTLYSFYIIASIYILSLCICSIAHIGIANSILNFSTEDGKLIVFQTLCLFFAFFPIWGLFSLPYLIISRSLSQGKRTSKAFTWNKIYPLFHGYGVILFIMGGTMLLLDSLSHAHYWSSISLITGVFFLFLLVLYGPLLWYNTRGTAGIRYKGVTFAELTRYFPDEQRIKEQ